MRKRSIKYLLVGLCSLTSIWEIEARQLTPEEALARVEATVISTRTIATPELVGTIHPKNDNDFTSLYLYETYPGFIIVSADDCAIPLLGYSESYSKDLPPALEWLLEFYASEIAKASVGYEQSVSTTTGENTYKFKKIEPLLQSKWNQGAPYNLLCPDFEGKHTLTGCVATAMAQIMNYHQWPLQCEGGEKRYTSISRNEGFAVELSIDYDEIEFDWQNMLSSYDENYSETAGYAVANLMRAVGYGVNMGYGLVASDAYGENEGLALNDYFKYSDYFQTPDRSYYTLEEWNELIYDQLIQGLPVLYNGITPNGEGHEFICDGYDGNGYFHINWGWGGYCDGYYLFTALFPTNQVTGEIIEEYNYRQLVRINIFPQDQEYPGINKYLLYILNDFCIEGMDPQDKEAIMEFKLGEYAVFLPPYKEYGVQNRGVKTLNGNFGIMLKDDDEEEIELYNSVDLSIKQFHYYHNFPIFIPSTLKEGHYAVHPIFKIEGEPGYYDLKSPVSGVKTLELLISEGKAIFSFEKIEDAGLSDIENASMKRFSIYSSSGLLLNSNASEQDLENLQKGIYIIESRQFRKIIVI